MHLTKGEQEVMDVFWYLNKPLSQAELVAAAQGKSWKDRSAYLLLNGLLEKGFLKESGYVRSGKTIARVFEPAITCEEYLAGLIAAQRWKADLPKLLQALLAQEETVSSALLANLRAVLDDVNA